MHAIFGSWHLKFQNSLGLNWRSEIILNLKITLINEFYEKNGLYVVEIVEKNGKMNYITHQLFLKIT
jgi:hypothetical protein